MNWYGYIIAFIAGGFVAYLVYCLYKKINIVYPDPIDCEAFKDTGCSHIDGPLCTYPSCDIRATYLRSKYAVIPIVSRR